MPIPALMTTPYAGAKPAPRGRSSRPAAPAQTQTALQIMSRLTGADMRPAPTTTDNLAAARDSVFRDLRGGPSSNPADMMLPAPGSFGESNTLANAGIYAPGSYGDQNARANGTGFNPAQMMAGSAETHGFTGDRGDAAALNNGLDAWARGGAPAPAGRVTGTGSAVDMMAGLPAGPAAALKVSDMRTSLAGARTQARDIDPVMTMLTPGLSPEQRNASLYQQAEHQRNTGVPPEMAADRMGYLDKLALRASGVPEAMGSARPVMIGGDENAHPTLGSLARAPTGAPIPTATDVNHRAVEMMAGGARSSLSAARAPQFVEDPVTGARKAIFGGKMETSGTNPAKVTPKSSPGSELKKLIDERDAFAKAGRTELLQHYDRAIANFGHKAATMEEVLSRINGQPMAGLSAPVQPKPGDKAAPSVIYNHADVQAELVRRGLLKAPQ